MGHARAILPIEGPEQQVKLFHLIVEQDLSVRRVEQLVRDFSEGRILDFAELQGEPTKKTGGNTSANDAGNDYCNTMAEHLAEKFSAKVKMTCNDKGQGKITIAFKNDEELQNIIALLDKIER